MSMSQRERQALDRYITGDYGERQFDGLDDEDEADPPGDLTTEAGQYRAWHDATMCARDAHGCACPCHHGYQPEVQP